ncbi:MFS transporter [Skermania sp. ID1734]|uniref:MFS transporter n=1 Tax=Skermania sp. ID1734 TaxID=2597516 RepID=UPI00118129E7|nr:MFS transporter [Skermania sp. ID1734]TSE00803.1 MFS transporter [Skermania sp. ID1734]
MSDYSAPVGDTRTLLGMHTKKAWSVAGLFLLSLTASAISSWSDVSQRWPIVIALLVTAIAGMALLATSTDPLPRATALMIAACGPLACALVLSVIPAPASSSAQLWPYPAGTACTVYLCLRGRPMAGWLDMLGMLTIAGIWGEATGVGATPTVLPQTVNIAPLLMANFFAYVIRPAAKQIVELREESTRRVAQQSATAATLAEHAQQTRRIDELMRPVLLRLTQPRPLHAHERLECALLEAQLRDSLRAPALADVAIAQAARGARARGIDVILVDDHGLDDAPSDVRAKLRNQVIDELESVRAGSVAVRVLPPNRSLLATIVVADPDTETRRIGIDHTGEATSTTDEAVQQRLLGSD